MNKVEITGGLVRDPELRFTQNGFAIMELTVAVNEPRYDSKEKSQVVNTSYIACVAFGWLAESIADLDMHKGDEAYVIGKLDQRTIEKDDGSKESKTKVEIVQLSPMKVRTGQRREETPKPVAQDEEPF